MFGRILFSLLLVGIFPALALTYYGQEPKSVDSENTIQLEIQTIQSWLSTISVQQDLEKKYAAPSESSVDGERSRLKQSMTSLQAWIRSNPGWQKFLNYDAILQTLDASDKNAITILLTDRQVCNWLVARDSVNNPLVGKIHSQLREFRAINKQWKESESSSTRIDRLKRLEEKLKLIQNTPSTRLRSDVILVVEEMETFGQASTLCADIKKQWLRPNLIIRGPQTILLPSVPAAIDDSFPTSGVYNGLQTTGTCNVKGSQKVTLVQSSTALEFEVSLQGTSSASSQGSNSRVTVQSTAESRLYAAKRGAIFGWGRKSFGDSIASAPTTISYDSIVPRGGRVAQREIISEVRSSTRSSELQAQQETESSLRKQMDQAVEKASRAADLTPIYKLRDMLMTTDPQLLSIGWNTSSDHFEIGVKCYSRTSKQIANLPPRNFKSNYWTIALHESLLSTTLNRLLLDSKLGMTYLPGDSTQSAKGVLVSTESGEKVEVVFHATTPVYATCMEDRIQTTMLVHSLSDGSTTFNDCRIEIDWQPSFQGQEIRLDRLERLKVLPIDFDPSKDRLNVRELSAFRVLERALNQTIASSQTIQLQVAQWLGNNGNQASLAIQDGWLLIECKP